MNKKEAAEYLSISARSLERYTKARRLSVTYEKGKTRPVATYDDDELAAFKDELAAGVHQPAEATATMPTNADTNRAKTLATFDSQPAELATDEVVSIDRMAEFAGVLAAAMARARPSVPISDKLLLTVTEAAELAGLSSGAIRAAIKAGDLEAKKGNWRGYRIRRRDLEEFTDGL
jgi:excisionase family DNA binding protein